jgi:transcriptional regulator with XRE-family HTH domain
MVNLSLADRMVLARKNAHITQHNLAKMLGVAVSTLNKYEKGHRTPDAKLLAQIAETVRCDPGWLLSGRESSATGLPRIEGYDPDLMHEIIETLEELFEKEGLSLPGPKKAELVDLLYQELHGVQHTRAELMGKILRFTKLAS